MATESLSIRHTASKTVYFCIWQLDDPLLVFDFYDSTFKELGSATEPYVTSTELSDGGGYGFSDYFAEVNLVNINNTSSNLKYKISAFEMSGGSPVPTTDSFIGENEIDVVLGINATKADIRLLAGSSGAADILAAFWEGGCVADGIVDSVSSAASFTSAGVSALSTTNDFYNGTFLLFTSGLNKGISRKVSDYIGSTTKRFTFDGSLGSLDYTFPTAPSVDDTFILIGRG
jgi:hypothetical protein